ncbi:hypothetical protein ACFL54_06250 [Planctomycetota bacterium]
MPKFRCLHCHKIMKVANKYSGKKIKCPECGVPIEVPQPDSENALETGRIENPYLTRKKQLDGKSEYGLKPVDGPKERYLYNPEEKTAKMPSEDYSDDYDDVEAMEAGGFSLNSKVIPIVVGIFLLVVIGIAMMRGDDDDNGRGRRPSGGDSDYGGDSMYGDDDDDNNDDDDGDDDDGDYSDLPPIDDNDPDAGPDIDPREERKAARERERERKRLAREEKKRLAGIEKARKKALKDFKTGIVKKPEWMFANPPAGEYDYKKWLEDLLNSEDKKDASAVGGAAIYVSLSLDENDIGRLVEIYKKQTEDKAKVGIASALGNYGNPEASAFLYEIFLESNNPNKKSTVAAEAFKQYCRNGNPEVLPELIDNFNENIKSLGRKEFIAGLRQIDFNKTNELLVDRLAGLHVFDFNAFKEIYDVGDTRALKAIVQRMDQNIDLRSFATLDTKLIDITYTNPFDVGHLPAELQERGMNNKIKFWKSWVSSNRTKSPHQWAEDAAKDFSKSYFTARKNVERFQKAIQRLRGKQGKSDNIKKLNIQKSRENSVRSFMLRGLLAGDHPGFASAIVKALKSTPVDDRDGKQMMNRLESLTGTTASAAAYKSKVEFWIKWERGMHGKKYSDQMASMLRNPVQSRGKGMAIGFLCRWTFHDVTGVYASVYDGYSDQEKWLQILDANPGLDYDGWLRAAIERDISLLENEDDYMEGKNDKERQNYRLDLITNLRRNARNYFDFQPASPKNLRDTALQLWREWWDTRSKTYRWDT